jgi:hypothetical protein
LNAHLAQLFFGGELGGLKWRVLSADLPDGMMDGHAFLFLNHL